MRCARARRAAARRAARLVVETYTPMRDLAMHGQISHRIVPAGPDLRIWPAEPDLTDLEGRLYFRVNTYNGVIPTRYPIQRVGV